MPVHYARRLMGRHRDQRANRHLGLWLAAVAGAANAGGFLAVQRYTSHMTGLVSSMADDWILGRIDLVLSGLGGLVSFVLGAITSSLMIHFSRRRELHSEYALPLMLEAMLLLCFGLLGAQLATIDGLFVPLTVMLLCFIMGLQNAVVTTLSGAEIRTTHVTGTVTDIGIELGRLLYRNRSRAHRLPPVRADRSKLAFLLSLLACFSGGALAGAWSFKTFGYSATIPLAVVLMTLAMVPLFDDARRVRRPR